jgi:hypothetical protein
MRLPLSPQKASPPSVTDTTEFVSARHTSPVSSRKPGLPRSAIIIGLIALVIIGSLIFALVKSYGNASPTVVATPVPKPMTYCTRYQLSVLNMNVSAVSDGLGFGGTLETTWMFSVNGQTQTYNKNDLDVGVTNVGLKFLVDVPTDTSTIAFSGSGKEHDTFSDDDLPGFTQVWEPTQNWGLGSQSVSGTNSSITYALNYQIACA